MSTKFCCRLCSDETLTGTELDLAPIFSNWYSLESHLYQVHMNNSFPFECDACNAQFQSNYNLLRHRQRVHLLNLCAEPFPQCFVIKLCPVPSCSYEKEQFGNYEELKAHLLNFHAETFRCSKKLKNNSENKSVKHSGVRKSFNEGARYICPHKKCGATYSTRKLFNNHLNDHDIFESDKCDRCQKRALSVQSSICLGKPENNESEESKCSCFVTHKFQCSIELCRKVFTTQHNLRMHSQQCHAAEVIKYYCKFCENLFNSERSLFEHIQVHINPKSFICNLCGEYFNQQTGLTRHIATVHQGRRSHFCCVCGKSFSQSGNLDTHLRNIHKLKCEKCFGEFQAETKPELEEHVRNCNGHVIYLMENDNCDLQQEVTVSGS
ncbi:uncharacterized protein LOC142352198 [Convolutriloba macropyga]|uniref:uncharacterized protein LOC142352198 n=1 Tax=Convolutriloba macropyga TaxID=536237 RepID=UPI003F520BA0